MNAGTNANCPKEEDWSIEGIIRLQIEAATITPAANPVRQRWTIRLSSFFIKKTKQAPSVVPANGIAMPCIT